MTAALILYYLIGCIVALIASTQWHRNPDIPWTAFAETILIWPYTLYLIFRRR